MAILRSRHAAAPCGALLLASLAGCLPPAGVGVPEPRAAQVVDASDAHAHDASVDAARRWSVRRGRALRLWIEPAPRVDGFTRAHAAAAERAADSWSAGAPVRVLVVPHRELADIVIAWVPDAPGRIRGITQRWVDAGGDIVRARIWIAVRTRGERTASSPEVIHAIALHELGHALGLGHSEDPEDIMYHDLYARDLSVTDRTRLSLLYRPAPNRQQHSAGPRHAAAGTGSTRDAP